MKPARFVLSVGGVALFLALATVLILSIVAKSSGSPMLDGGAGAGTVLALVLLAVLVIRAALLWADNRKQGR